MPNELDARPNQWYSRLDKGQRFLVVGIDEDAGTVEAQHFDGDVEEFSVDEWRQLDIELSEVPENWAGPFDIAEQDDLGTDITDTRSEDWTEPQQDFRPAGQERLRSEPEEPTDDYGEGHIEEEPLE